MIVRLFPIQPLVDIPCRHEVLVWNKEITKMFEYLRDIFRHECVKVAREARGSTWRRQRDGIREQKDKFHNPVYHRFDPRLMDIFRMVRLCNQGSPR